MWSEDELHQLKHTMCVIYWHVLLELRYSRQKWHIWINVLCIKYCHLSILLAFFSFVSPNKAKLDVLQCVWCIIDVDRLIKSHLNDNDDRLNVWHCLFTRRLHRQFITTNTNVHWLNVQEKNWLCNTNRFPFPLVLDDALSNIQQMLKIA